MIGLRGGEWRFFAQAVGYSPQGGALLVRTGSPNPPLTFQLERSGVAYFGALAGIMAKDIQRDFAEADRMYVEQRWDEAIVAYREILEHAPVLTAIHLQIGAAYRQKKDYDAAIAEYGRLLEAEPGNTRASLEIALTWLERGDPRAAEEVLVKATEQAATRDVFYTLGEIRLSANDPAGATGWFEKASAADPNWAKPLLKLGQVALARGENEEAARHLARAAEVDPEAPEAAAAKSTLATLKK
jgi:tetratricopeptide (TPR) repeat protein